MQNYLKYIPMGLFAVYFLKVCLQPVTMTEAAILLILGSVAAFYEFKSNDKKILELEAQIKNQQILIESRFKEFDGVKSQVASIKLASNYRTQNTNKF